MEWRRERKRAPVKGPFVSERTFRRHQSTPARRSFKSLGSVLGFDSEELSLSRNTNTGLESGSVVSDFGRSLAIRVHGI
jgi:hypothetical protein